MSTKKHLCLGMMDAKEGHKKFFGTEQKDFRPGVIF